MFHVKQKGGETLDIKTLREIEDIIEDMEIEARRNSTKFLQEGNRGAYSYWRGKRSALSDLSIKISEMKKTK